MLKTDNWLYLKSDLFALTLAITKIIFHITQTPNVEEKLDTSSFKHKGKWKTCKIIPI